MKPKISMKKYMNELNKMTGNEMLKEYLTKVMPVYMIMGFSNSYSISFEELRAMGLKDLGEFETLELVENILSEHFDDKFEVEYECYLYRVDDAFIKITLVE